MSPRQASLRHLRGMLVRQNRYLSWPLRSFESAFVSLLCSTVEIAAYSRYSSRLWKLKTTSFADSGWGDGSKPWGCQLRIAPLSDATNGRAVASTRARCHSPEKLNTGTTGLQSSASAPNAVAKA